MYSLTKAVDKLHEYGIVHRDLKQGNFLYHPDRKKGIIIDFGLAEIVPRFLFSSQEIESRTKEEDPQPEKYERI
mgnify:FL=1|jgi:Serine/threonine protein kinase